MLPSKFALVFGVVWPHFAAPLAGETTLVNPDKGLIKPINDFPSMDFFPGPYPKAETKPAFRHKLLAECNVQKLSFCSLQTTLCVSWSGLWY